MSKQVMVEVALATQQGQMSFPDATKRLLEAGVESYIVELATMQKIHHLSDGSTYVPHMIVDGSPIAADFNADDLRAALDAARAGEIKYPEFLKRIAAAGVLFYFMVLGDCAIYQGRKGETFTVQFPKAK